MSLVSQHRAPLKSAQGLVVFVVSLASLSSCSREPPSPVERGRGTFIRMCSGCHGLDGRGLPRGVQLPIPPQNLADPEFHRRRTDEQLRFVLRNGKGSMPPFGMLLEERQIEELLAYIRTLPEPANTR